MVNHELTMDNIFLGEAEFIFANPTKVLWLPKLYNKEITETEPV